MPHDKNGKELGVGDVIVVPAIIKKIEATETYCNVTVETVHPMYPADYPSQLTLNARQCELKEKGGDFPPAPAASSDQ